MKRSIYSGYSMKEFNDIRTALDHNHIAYKTKVRDRQGGFSDLFSTTRSRTGSAGMNKEYEKQYEILVDEKDYDSARHAVRQQR